MKYGKTGPDADPLSGLRVVITGGTSGLGLALVRGLAEAGADVAFVARTLNRVREVARSVPGAHGFVADVSAKDVIHPVVLEINAALGGVDLLVNNASSLGPTPLAPLADTECEEVEEALATNVLGPFRLTKALLGSLSAAAREGRPALVVNISSDAAVEAYPGWGAYGASKAALAHLSRIWDAELEGHGIRVITHDPGDMATPLHHAAVPDADPQQLRSPEESAAELLERLRSLAVARVGEAG